MNNKDHIVGGSVASFIQVSSFFDHLAATFFSNFIDTLLFFSQISFRKDFVINTRFGISFFCTRHDCFGDLVSCIHLLCVSGLIFQNIVSCDFQSFCFISLLLFQALLAYVVILVRSIIFYLDSVRSKLQIQNHHSFIFSNQGDWNTKHNSLLINPSFLRLGWSERRGPSGKRVFSYEFIIVLFVFFVLFIFFVLFVFVLSHCLPVFYGGILSIGHLTETGQPIRSCW